VFLNKADTMERIKSGMLISQNLISCPLVDKIIIGSIGVRSW
jgi:hypothetical protein